MNNAITCEQPHRILFDEEAVQPDSPELESTKSPDTDFHRIDDLLNRCWQELNGIELNVKLTDLIRLLEFKHKLGPGAQAEKEFWSLIDTIRREELSGFGDPDPKD